MSQARAVARNTAVLAAARLIERFGNLILTVIISRELGASGLGTYATAIAYFGIIAAAAESGTTNLLVREISSNKDDTNAYLVHGSLMSGSIALGVTAIGLAVLQFVDYPADEKHAVELILLALVAGTLNTIQESVFVAHQRVEFETLSTLGASLLTILISVVLLSLGYGVVSLVIAFVVTEYLVTIVYFILINRYITRLHLKVDRVFARRFYHEVKPFAGSSFLQAGMSRPEILILSFVGTPAQVGYYSAALKIADLWQFIPSVFMINVFPALSRAFREGTERARRIQDLALRYLVAIGLPLAVGMIVTAEQIISAFFGDGFDESVTPLRIMATVIVFYSVSAVLWRVLAARGEQARVLRTQVVALTFRLIGGYVLISQFAEVGAALTMTISLLILTVVLALQVRSDGTPVPIVRPNWRAAAAAALMGVVLAIVAEYADLWVDVAVGAIAYVGFLLLLRAFSEEDRELARNVMPVWRRRRHAE